MATQTASNGMMVSAEGLAFIQRHEGFRPDAVMMPDGRLVIGHGHIVAAAPATAMTRPQAEQALLADLAPIVDLLNQKLLAPVNQTQFDALASFAFSIGPKSFQGSDVLRRFNAGEPIAAAVAMDAWSKSAVLGQPQVIDALVRRRAAEKAMFLSAEPPVAAPSAFLQPSLDHAQAILSATAIANAPSLETAMPTQTVGEPEALTEADKLTAIFESEPATAQLLNPATALSVEPVLEPFTLPAAADNAVDAGSVLELTQEAPAEDKSLLGAIDPRETRAFVLLAVAGLLLIGVGAAVLFAGVEGGQTAFLMLSAPGIVIAGMAGYYLARTRFTKPMVARRGPTNLQGVAA